MTNFVIFLKDLLSFVMEIINMISGDGSSVIAQIGNTFPEAINKVLENDSFNAIYEIMVPVGIGLAAVFMSIDIIEKRM